jgi:hypothetical protein
MRTTITVDADVEQLLRLAMQQSGQSLKATLNQAVRRGLAGTVVAAAQPPFWVESQRMGLRAGIDPARLQELGDELDVQAFLELSRRLRPAASER